MNGMMVGLLLLMMLEGSVCYAITLKDVQILNKHNFFSGWSKFLDQILDTRIVPVSRENEALYQAFIQQAEKLNIPKVTGNKESISEMKKQMDAIKKNMNDEKKFLADWSRFHDAIISSGEYPLSPKNEKLYKEFVERAKGLNFKKPVSQELQKKIKTIGEKLTQPVVVEEVAQVESVPVEEPVKQEIAPIEGSPKEGKEPSAEKETSGEKIAGQAAGKETAVSKDVSAKDLAVKEVVKDTADTVEKKSVADDVAAKK